MDGYIGSEYFLIDGKSEIIGDNWAIVNVTVFIDRASAEHPRISNAKRRRRRKRYNNNKYNNTTTPQQPFTIIFF